MGTTPVEKRRRACRDPAEKALGANQPPTCGCFAGNRSPCFVAKKHPCRQRHPSTINEPVIPRSSMMKFKHTPIKPQKSNHKFFQFNSATPKGTYHMCSNRFMSSFEVTFGTPSPCLSTVGPGPHHPGLLRFTAQLCTPGFDLASAGAWTVGVDVAAAVPWSIPVVMVSLKGWRSISN